MISGRSAILEIFNLQSKRMTNITNGKNQILSLGRVRITTILFTVKDENIFSLTTDKTLKERNTAKCFKFLPGN